MRKIPGSPRFSVLQAMESWAGPGYKATHVDVLIFFHSLERNKIGDSGAAALANALMVNQSLKTLK